MKIKRDDGRVFEWEFLSFGRGEWATNLVAVDGGYVNNGIGDPTYRSEREARRAAREMTPTMTYWPGLGWCAT